MTGDHVYDPGSITIAIGDRIVWYNAGSAVHTVTGYDGELSESASYFASGGFESESAAREDFPEGGIEADGTFSHTSETADEYRYFCIPHEQIGMPGSVSVER